MPDYDKIIEHLWEAVCVPHYDNAGNVWEYPKEVQDAANAAIEAIDSLTTPRVMTLEELDDYRKTEEGADPYITSEKTPVMVEYSNDVPYNTRWLTIESLNSWLDYRDMRVIYGKEWRCWSARPTEEQRKAVKWGE